MARVAKKRKKRASLLASPPASADPEGFAVWVHRFVVAIAVKGQTESTQVHHKHALEGFAKWCAERSITRPAEVTRPIIESYQRHLYHRRLPSGRPLTFGTQYGLLGPLKVFFRWLARTNAILWNPASDIDLPKIPFRIPRDVLTHEEAERVLAQPNLKMPEGLRDRAIFETFYSTGMRRCELIALHLHDVDADRCTILIRDGKGRRDRMVPLGQRAKAWIFKYTSEARPKLVTDPNDTVLFVSNRGEALAEATLSAMARDYIVASGVKKHGACHIFRHSMATAMLENGADVRFIQAILGHTSLNSTAIYTHVAIRKLVEIHERTHPAAVLKRKPRTGKPEPEAEKLALLAALDDEPEGHDDGP